jgi:hypothetical protein
VHAKELRELVNADDADLIEAMRVHRLDGLNPEADSIARNRDSERTRTTRGGPHAWNP